jgi:hypothetical protein
MNPNNINQLMQNMIALGMMKNLPFDPSTDTRHKRMFISQNITEAKSGLYQKFQKYETVPFFYVENCDPGKTDSICEVKVVHEHALDVAETYADRGHVNFTKQNKMNPVVLNVVSSEFIATAFESNDDMRDDIINIRTTFCVCPQKNSVFPLKEKQCAYTPLVTVIRPKNPKMTPAFLPLTMLYRTALISAAPIKQEGIIKKFSSKDFMASLENIECAFQCAVGNDHQVLILTPFGHKEDNNPINDIIKIYNYCIMKYSHKFKNIIIAIPPHHQKEIFEVYAEKIINPMDLTKLIDDKYESIENEKRMKEKLQKKSSEKSSKNDETNDTQALHLLMQMMKENPKMMEMVKKNKLM